MTTKKRLQGLRALVADVVEHGSTAVEVVHKATAARTFFVLEAIPPIAKPAKVIHIVHDASLTGIYGMIRAVNRVVAKGLEVALDASDPTDGAADGAADATADGATDDATDGAGANDAR